MSEIEGRGLIKPKKRILRTDVLSVRDRSNTLIPPTDITMSMVVLDWEADHIVQYIRPEDRRDLEAALPLEIKRFVEASLAQSTHGGVLRRPAKVLPWEPFAIFGLVPWDGLPHAAKPWLFGTPALDEYGIRLLRMAPKILADMASAGGFTHLENHVHAENTRDIQLIERLGFTVGEAAPWGHKGALFRRFWRDMGVDHV